MVAKIFIDGEAGTTGLQIRDRLSGRRDFELLSIGTDKRKDKDERKRLLNAADVAILCLPDESKCFREPSIHASDPFLLCMGLFSIF